MIKKLIRNLVLREKASSDKFVAHLRKKGVEVGENVRFYSPANSVVDLTAPWLLTIGNNCNFTHGVIILTHDYSWSVLKKTPKSAGRIFGAQSPVTIGNNVFVGMNTVITRGVTIGDNVIIGAGSVVTKDCESNSVYAGNPAKRIMSVDEYRAKREQKQFEEAREMALIYRKKFSKDPPKEVFYEYFMLFTDASEASACEPFCAQMKTSGNYEETFRYMKNNKPMFNSFEEFLAQCYLSDYKE